MAMCLFDLCDDILELIEVELEPRLKYNKVVREYKDPRFHKSTNRIIKDMKPYHGGVHPGRHYLRVIYPMPRGFCHWCINRFKCEDINLYGMLIRTDRSRYHHQHHDVQGDVASSSSIRDYTHNDIDVVLTQLGVKRFKSLLKREKLSKVIKFKECAI